MRRKKTGPKCRTCGIVVHGLVTAICPACDAQLQAEREAHKNLQTMFALAARYNQRRAS